MVGPNQLDGFCCADASATGVAAGAKPVVLRGACRSGTESRVGCSINCRAQDTLLEDAVVGDDCCRQVMRHAFKDLEQEIYVLVSIFGHNLEWAKKLGRKKLELLLPSEVLKRYIDRCGLERTIDCWNLVRLRQRLSTKQNFCSVELQHRVDVSLDPFVCPGKHWTDREVLQVSLGCLTFD